MSSDSTTSFNHYEQIAPFHGRVPSWIRLRNANETEEHYKIYLDEIRNRQYELHTIALIVAGIFSILAIVVSMQLILQHNRNLSKPAVQSKIIGILWMVPIYSVDSWFSLRYTGASVYLDMGRDCYEAYVIYLFLSLMITYLGDGDDLKVIEILEPLPPVAHPFPMNYVWSPITLDKEFLRKCKLGAVQFVVLKPITTLVAVLLETQGMYEQGSFRIDRGYGYVVFVQNVSITVAFYYLVLFYVALHEQLSPFNAVPKFICVKAVLFLSFWQGVLLAGLADINIIHDMGSWTVDNISTGVQNLLLCFEMFVAAVAHCYAFPADEFTGEPSQRAPLLQRNFAIVDAVRDFNDVMPGRVVLPTGFKPGSPTIISRRNAHAVPGSAANQRCEASRLDLEFGYGEVDQEGEGHYSSVDSTGSLGLLEEHDGSVQHSRERTRSTSSSMSTMSFSSQRMTVFPSPRFQVENASGDESTREALGIRDIGVSAATLDLEDDGANVQQKENLNTKLKGWRM